METGGAGAILPLARGAGSAVAMVTAGRALRPVPVTLSGLVGGRGVEAAPGRAGRWFARSHGPVTRPQLCGL